MYINSSHPSLIDGSKQRQEWSRRNKLPAADRELFDFLNDYQQNRPKPKLHGPIDGAHVVLDYRQRQAMDPEMREKLEFLEEAKRQLDSFQPGLAIDGRAQLQEQAYLDSLTPDQRDILNKVRTENSLRPGGVYPFNLPKPRNMNPQPDQFRRSNSHFDPSLLDARKLAFTLGTIR
ncbi:MAG: hypothetical protein KC800_05290 [Candidatus Eremiobacteraeota bacterium]|nr:hypothetical protein [Candidatus Eremiobacteraeota bacterium]